MALCITHNNLSEETYPIQLQIKTDSVTIQLGPNQEFWTESHEMTPALRIFQRKNLVKIVQDNTSKPDDFEYYKVYTIGEAPKIGTIAPKKANLTTEEVINTNIENIPPSPEYQQQKQQEMMNALATGLQKQPVNSVASILEKAEKQVEDYKKSDDAKTEELKTGTWEDSEVTYLKRMYSKKSAGYIGEKLNRSEKSVRKKAELLGLRKNKA